MVRRIGIFKWWWDKTEETKTYKQEGIDEQQLQALASDDSIEFTDISPRKDGLFDVDFTHTTEDGRARVEAVPPEEFIRNRNARNLDRALVVGHRTFKTRGELLAMGISEADIEEHGGSGEQGNASNPEVASRANDKIEFVEALMTIDKNGDGKAELLCVKTIGPNYYPVEDYPAYDKGFAVFTPYPEPHTLEGGSVADRTMDVQKINSSLLRGMLDSMALSIFPRPIYVEGQASVADIMNTAIGAPIRERVMNSVRWDNAPFIGKEAMPVMQFMQEVIERRTGRNKGAAGLDADALQSTGKEAVGAVLTGSQEQAELMVRVFCEGTLKPLFRGIGRLLQQKQPRSRMVRLRGQWVEVDPRSWDDQMDVTVNVALGSTFTEKKVQTLMAVAADQENFVQSLGLANPAVPLPKLLQTRRKIMELQGLKDFESYYNVLAPDWQPPEPEAPGPTPEMLNMQAQAEMSHVKSMKELAIKLDELKLKKEEMDMKREESLRDQSNIEFEQAFKLEELSINAELERLKIEAQIATQEAARDVAGMERESKAGSDAALKEVKDDLRALAGKEHPAPVVNVMPHDLSALKAPVVNVPAPVVNVPAPIVNVPPPAERKRGKRKVKAKKEKDGSFTFESDGD
jgi:hypothetical protein